MKRYKVIFDEENTQGVYAISVVKSPAMESNFIALSKNNKPSLNVWLKETDEGKKENTLLGVALIPDKPVYRNQDGEEFEIIFDKETIKQTAHNFLKQGFNHNSSIEHEEKIDGVSIVESWIVKDSNNDASLAYGLDKNDIVEGTWVVKMKCDNEEIYNKAVNGEIQGFSIDGLFDLQEVKLKSNKMQEEIKNISKGVTELKQFIASLFENKKEDNKIELGSVKSKDGDDTIMFEGETLEAGVAVYIEQDEERIALPSGTYELEDNKILVVEEEGIVLEVREVEAETEEEAEVEMSNDEMITLDELKSILAEFKSQNDAKVEEITKSFEAKFSAQNEVIEKQENILTELCKCNAEESVKAKPTQSRKNESLTEFLNNRK